MTAPPSTQAGTDGPPEELVIIIDDDAMVRDATEMLLRSVGYAVLCFERPQDALEADWPEVPGCIVLDIRLPQFSGLDLQRRLAERGTGTPVIFMTGHGDIPMTVSAMKAGAADFLTKPYRDQDLLDAVSRAIEADRARRAEGAALDGLRRAHAGLTPREREVLDGVARGLLNKQIAGELGLAEITVKLHRSSMMKKMGLRTVAELVRAADLLSSAQTRV
ncbi:response regulator transcription factor [Poseidonocella sp. HB161398]|uniref:response regulator transcription factor n=1 Tax=Poseidonocella sp. HB161398 TaxID=2320855 RepID=UPI001109865C|nr:response regulator transcription factor [Poseidonocella sp. HB161398]